MRHHSTCSVETIPLALGRQGEIQDRMCGHLCADAVGYSAKMGADEGDTPTGHPRLGFRIDRCRFSKLDPREFIGGFGRLAIACLHGDADKRRDLGRAKRTPNPYLAAFGIDRAATSNRGAGAQPNSSSLLPSLRSPVLDLAIALVVGLARKPGDRPAGDRLALAPQRLVRNVEISVTWSLARRASKGFPRGPRSDHADGP